jgi:pimeloyl-ACP methyl ester carboxylesterase
VLTLNYRGTWGSAGDFSFAGAAEDSRAALAFLKRPENVGRYGIDPSRIAVAGHSMGGMMAADAAAHDASIKGLFLIDPWDMSADGRAINTPAGAKAWHEEMLVDQPALSGTDEATLAAELRATVARFDLTSRLTAYGRRPLDIIGAERGGGTANAAILQAIRASANTNATGDTWPTDHSFNDRRIALAERFVAWLAKLPGGRP